MQISPITHADYFAVIIAVHARGHISYDGEFRGYSSHLEKFTVKYCPFNLEPAGRSYFCNTFTVELGCIFADEYHATLSRFRYLQEHYRDDNQ